MARKASLSLTAVALLAACATNLTQDDLHVLKLGPSGLFYEEVVPVEGASASDIYDRALVWMVRSYRSANDVIQLQDKENKRIIGKGIYSVPFMLINVRVRHTISLETRDGRYKVRLDSFSVLADYGEWDLSKANSTQTPIVTNTEKAVEASVTDLKASVASSPAGDKW